jgi:FkbH-like protein
MKIALLSSYTADLFPGEVDKRMPAYGLTAEWYVAPFNQYRQEILSPDAPSKKFQPSIVLLLLNDEELLSFAPESLRDLLEQASKGFPASTVLVNTCTSVRAQAMRLLEWNTPDSRRIQAARINLALADAAQALRNVFVLDHERVVATYGGERMFDPRYYYLAKMQYSGFGLQKIAEQAAMAIAAIAGVRKKCLVLDLDNTLWGGVLGEEGMEHIRLSNDGEGKAYFDFQQQLLRYFRTGTILAICSKNDEDIALDAIERHPFMVLRKEHFAAWRINWVDKVTNMRAIADELNLGLDSFVYLDDSPHERNFVRSAIPEITVPDLPADASAYPGFAAAMPYFETFTVTAEDTERGKSYVEERKRSEIHRTASSVDEFLSSLNIRVSVRPADEFTYPRVAQLTQKTNQFNLTTRRYTEGDIRSRAADTRWKVLYATASDTIGDSGIVGAALVELRDRVARLDTFLVSCRVLGRGIEQAFLAEVEQAAKDAGCDVLHAEYIPTKKNGMAKDFLSASGFVREGERYVYDLGRQISFPSWIQVTEHEQR